MLESEASHYFGNDLEAMSFAKKTALIIAPATFGNFEQGPDSA